MKIEPKIALVYDRVNTPHGGAENVLLALHEIFPEAPLYTSVYDPERAPWAKEFQVQASFLQHLPFAKKLHRLYVPLMPVAFESFDFSEFDIVISVTSAEAKGILTKPNQLHICYLLTPTRYLWSHAEEYEQHWLSGWLRKKIFAYLRWWDEAAAVRPDIYIPISKLVAQRCQMFYHRKTESVIYPSVGITPKKFSPHTTSDYYLIVSRLVPYKHIDLAIQVCQKLDRNLTIIGEGPDLHRLKKLVEPENATAKVRFLQAVQPTEVVGYYQGCRAFLAPAEEDFGMTTLEAMSFGKPVIIYSPSGSAELVKEGVDGIHFFSQTTAGLSEAIHIFESRQWDAKKIQQHISDLTREHFQNEFKEKIMDAWTQFRKEGGHHE